MTDPTPTIPAMIRAVEADLAEFKRETLNRLSQIEDRLTELERRGRHLAPSGTQWLYSTGGC